MDLLLTDLETKLRERWDDDERWAVYADALLASGDARGELISLELRLARGEDPALRAAIEALRSEHERREESEALLKYGWELGWERGFITRLRTIDLGEASEIEGLASLLADPALRMLRRLELRVSKTAPAPVFAAVTTLELGPLRALQIADASIDDQLADARWRLPETLVELDLRYAGLSDRSLAAVLERAPPLRRLSLQHNALSPAGADHIAHCEALTQLQFLDLRGNPLTAAGARRLAQATKLRALETLLIDRYKIGVRGMEALGESRALAPTITRFCRARAKQRRSSLHGEDDP